MRWNRVLAAGLALGAAAAAGLSTVAVAAPGGQDGLGLFRSWRAAQSAAGFRLLRPAATFGLARNGRIAVIRCGVPGQGAKRVVIANYGLTPRVNLRFTQDDYGRPCLRAGRVAILGHYTVHRARATLSGVCGRPGLPRCGRRNVVLLLAWRRRGIYYVASSFGEPRAALIAFARRTIAVG